MNMKIFRIRIYMLIILTCSFERSLYAWGKTGHEIVAQIAMHLLSDQLQDISIEYVGNPGWKMGAYK